MMGQRTALFFSGILSLVCARAAFNPEDPSVHARREMTERPLVLAGASQSAPLSGEPTLDQLSPNTAPVPHLGQYEGLAVGAHSRFDEQRHLARLDGGELDPVAARALFSKIQDSTHSPQPHEVIGCYEVIRDQLHTLNCLDALHGSLNPTSSRTYFVEVAELPKSQ